MMRSTLKFLLFLPLILGVGCNSIPSPTNSPQSSASAEPASPPSVQAPVTEGKGAQLQLSTIPGPMSDGLVSPETETIEATIQGLTPNTVVKGIWRADFGDFHQVTEVALEGGNDSCVLKIQRPLKGWKLGEYSLFVFQGGKALHTDRFRVGKPWDEAVAEKNFVKSNRGFAPPEGKTKGKYLIGKDSRTGEPWASAEFLQAGTLRLKFLFGGEEETHVLTLEQWKALSTLSSQLKGQSDQDLVKRSGDQFALEFAPQNRTVRVALVGVQGAVHLPSEEYFAWVKNIDSEFGLSSVEAAPLLGAINEPTAEELFQLSGANLSPLYAERRFWWPSVVRGANDEAFVLLTTEGRFGATSSLLLTRKQWLETAKLLTEGLQLAKKASKQGRTPIPMTSPVPFHVVVHVKKDGTRELELSRHQLELSFVNENAAEIVARMSQVTEELEGRPQWPRWTYQPDQEMPNRITYDTWHFRKKSYILEQLETKPWLLGASQWGRSSYLTTILRDSNAKSALVALLGKGVGYASDGDLLFKAIEEGSPRILDLLLKIGSDPTALNEQGLTPLAFAQEELKKAEAEGKDKRVSSLQSKLELLESPPVFEKRPSISQDAGPSKMSTTRGRFSDVRPQLEELLFQSGGQASEHFAEGQEDIQVEMLLSRPGQSVEAHLWSPGEVRVQTAELEKDKARISFPKPKDDWYPGIHRVIIYCDGAEIGNAAFTIWQPEALLDWSPKLKIQFEDEKAREAQMDSLPSNVTSVTLDCEGELPAGVSLKAQMTEPSGLVREVGVSSVVAEGESMKFEPLGMRKEFFYQAGPGSATCKFEGPFFPGEYKFAIIHKEKVLKKEELHIRNSQERFYPDSRLFTNERRTFELRLPEKWVATPDLGNYGDWTLTEETKPKVRVRTRRFKREAGENLLQAASRKFRITDAEINRQQSLTLGDHEALELVYRGGSTMIVIARGEEACFALNHVGRKQVPKGMPEALRAMMGSVRFTAPVSPKF